MSTLLDLVGKGLLRRYTLDTGELDVRQIFYLPRIEVQIQDRVHGTVSDRQLETKPEEQLDALLVDFCEGIELDAGTQFKKLKPLKDGIWELKTPDLRLFGWFYKKDQFIWTAVDAKWRLLESPGIVVGYINEAKHFRDTVFLFGEDYIKSDNPDDVISNAY